MRSSLFYSRCTIVYPTSFSSAIHLRSSLISSEYVDAYCWAAKRRRPKTGDHLNRNKDSIKLGGDC
ncbi:hypothetical protein HanRHA438_Chr12g0555881 [Helianthus annuus]|uniref:Uncharacterized protein n=1 Tax=Helianthus annuus TaxID=4232 RepID=A0A9K3MWB3_HELAN|nr:hypothetical protein HanXRQr2_Chr12g0544641 [Helianthus annuus]KAJ0489619.1 hypothetical protein HanHA300_Chr12g0446131 [Helianthus annuus]KAJ0505533.1 hypothetical protein HanHA89_Chr12g0471631 [Helianthus annuus]KAJ0675200.1 hypothetical protein HanLR1_Chr12g0448551 [Helianthus annuus]KAJ0862956.1 hypothetical protein HanPSC8_Chr12g0524301 [Helianthus annuus]